MTATCSMCHGQGRIHDRPGVGVVCPRCDGAPPLRFTVTLARLGVSPNERLTRAESMAAQRDVRDVTSLYARQALQRQRQRVAQGPRRLQLHVVWPAGHRLEDPDNLLARCKPLIDGLGPPRRGSPAGAGALLGDAPHQLRIEPPTQGVDPDAFQRVRVVVSLWEWDGA